MAGKKRLDDLLVDLNITPDRTMAMRLIMAGQVRVNGQLIFKPATTFPDTVEIQIIPASKYVSRGGEKLAAALQAFKIDVSGKICADVGASTGGFTDCLLQHGAKQVYAIDVGYGILDWKLRQNPKVVVMETTNARHIEKLPSPIQIVTIDVSFISLTTLLPVVLGWFKAYDEPGVVNRCSLYTVVALVKPQFEASREQVDRGRGVIRNPEIHQAVLEEVLAFAADIGYEVKGIISSPLLGPKGNREFLAWLVWPGGESPNLAQKIADAIR